MAGRTAADPSTAVPVNAGQPLILAGPPRSVRGHLDVQNLSDQKLVWLPRLLGARGVARDGILALRRIVVRPHTHRRVPIYLTLDPHTAPGSYEAKLDVAGEQRDVVIHVTEDPGFSMTPDSLVLANRPGGKFDRQVLFANHGNIPFTVRSIGAVVLDDELAGCRAVRCALHEVGATMKTGDEFVAALGHQFAKIYETSALKVRNDPITLEPGRSQLLDLRITLPEKLDARSRYTGFAPISTSNLNFTLVPD